MFLGPIISLFGSKKVASFMGKKNAKDLDFMKELVEAEKV